MLDHDGSTSRCAVRAVARLACTAGLSASLALGSALIAPASAFAASAATQAELAQLQQQIADAEATYRNSVSQADALQQQIDETAQEILDLEQNVIPEQRERAAQAASDLYKMQCNSPNIVSLLLQADSLEDFISTTKYLTVIQNTHTDELKRLDEVESDLNGKMDDLNAAQAEAAAQQQAASDALSTVQSAAAEVQKKADAENAAEAQAAAEAAQRAAAEQAAREQAAQQQAAAATDTTSTAAPETSGSTGSTSTGGSASSGSGSSQGGGSASAGSGSSNSGSSSSSGSTGGGSNDAGGWLTGVASYYGIGDGFMGGTCADGSIVTETSMGIAMRTVPLGTKVQISYGGKTVVATVVDRGPYSGNRVIDMQPAVARALNFVSVGVGTVSYRILG